jgi:P27 family predicted phage terminase small subunit
VPFSETLPATIEGSASMGALGSGRRPAGETALRLMPSKPMAALPGMTAGARRHWKRIMGSVPSDYFSPADAAQLVELCEAAALHDRAIKQLEAEGLTTKSTNGTVYPHPCIGIVKGAANTVATLSTKLRLAKSSRTPRDAASTQMNKPRTAKKPWEKF